MFQGDLLIDCLVACLLPPCSLCQVKRDMNFVISKDGSLWPACSFQIRGTGQCFVNFFSWCFWKRWPESMHKNGCWIFSSSFLFTSNGTSQNNTESKLKCRFSELLHWLLIMNRESTINWVIYLFNLKVRWLTNLRSHYAGSWSKHSNLFTQTV